MHWPERKTHIALQLIAPPTRKNQSLEIVTPHLNTICQRSAGPRLLAALRHGSSELDKARQPALGNGQHQASDHSHGHA
jgi:hypothetical protein